MTERTDEERVTGSLLVTVGGAERRLTTLKAKYVPEWARKLDAITPGSFTGDPREGFAAISKLSIDGLVDLIVAYDEAIDAAGVPHRPASLGRDWLEENADPAELLAIAKAMVSNAFPLGDAADLINSMLTALITGAVRSVQRSSTSGASTSGAVRRTRSAKRSTRSR